SIHNSGDTDGTANGSNNRLKTAVTGRHYAFRLHTAPFTPLRTTGKSVNGIFGAPEGTRTPDLLIRS
ncbi:MAG: hypothetical protein IJN61_01280, partial [Clostridia bacterium]|nr:hypothetical protein [Clostridia bacterium]